LTIQMKKCFNFHQHLDSLMLQQVTAFDYS
jgi:hypothetical protein